MPDIFKHLENDHDHAVTRLIDYLKIPSIGTDPAYRAQTEQAARWTADHLRESGFDPRIMPTDGHPVVVARTSDDMVEHPDAPRVLFYGHYDVQPPDPLEKWTTPAFEPTLRDGADGRTAIYARGASDDKGQVLCFLEALRAYKMTGRKLPCHVTVMIEGEEESGSINLPPFMETHKKLLAADVCVVSDTAMWAPGKPAITYALRGLVYLDVQLHGPSRDLHSGIYGGSMANPATMLTQVLGRLFDEKHRITIPGFYDDVAALSEEERAMWATLDFSDEQFLGSVGCEPFGEAGYSTLERRWARPSCDINGVFGGYMGEGAKTVIPTFAGAKVSFRICANMNPHKVADQFEQWLRSHDVHGCRWKITRFGEAWPVMVPRDSPWIKAACAAIEQAAGQAPVLVRDGATIPVVADVKRLLQVDTLLIGFGLHSDALHSPDEHFGLDRYQLGCQTHAALLQHFAASG